MNNIRPMQPRDVESVLQVHMDAFQGFFLTFLGPSFLREFYLGVCEDRSGIALVHGYDSISGFVVGTVETSGFYRRLIEKRWWKFGLAAIQPMVQKPSIIPRLLRAFTLSGNASNSQSGTGTLMSLAVRRNRQGQGIGKQLVSAFIESCRERQIEVLHLTTDAINNNDVNKFYLKMGFSCTQTFATPEGRLMNEYVFHFQ